MISWHCTQRELWGCYETFRTVTGCTCSLPRTWIASRHITAQRRGCYARSCAICCTRSVVSKMRSVWLSSRIGVSERTTQLLSQCAKLRTSKSEPAQYRIIALRHIIRRPSQREKNITRIPQSLRTWSTRGFEVECNNAAAEPNH